MSLPVYIYSYCNYIQTTSSGKRKSRILFKALPLKAAAGPDPHREDCAAARLSGCALDSATTATHRRFATARARLAHSKLNLLARAQFQRASRATRRHPGSTRELRNYKFLTNTPHLHRAATRGTRAQHAGRTYSPEIPTQTLALLSAGPLRARRATRRLLSRTEDTTCVWSCIPVVNLMQLSAANDGVPCAPVSHWLSGHPGATTQRGRV